MSLTYFNHFDSLVDHGSWIMDSDSTFPEDRAMLCGVEYKLVWDLSVFRKITMIMTSNIKLSCYKGRVLANAQ